LISIEKNSELINMELIKDIKLNKSPRTFGYLKILGVQGFWPSIFPLYWESMLAPNKTGG
jgi:hypothetical protein